MLLRQSAQCAADALREVVEERAAVFEYDICASVARSSDRQRLQIGSNITENRQHGFEMD